MGKRLPEELEAPDLKFARENKERRAMEARGKPFVETNPYLQNKEVREEQFIKAVETSTAVEGVKVDLDEIEEEIEEEVYKKTEKEIKKEVIKKRGKLPLTDKKTFKKWRK